MKKDKTFNEDDITYVEPADYFPKEIREKFFKDETDETKEDSQNES